MKSLFFIFFSIIFVAVAQAKVLVISDIDDTLKVSHVLSKKRAAVSALDDDSRFVGMAEIFQALKRNHKDIEFHYVSLAPKILMSSQHKEFLQENDFPLNEMHMNHGIHQDPQLKQKLIRKVLAQKKPELVIYFGDNGQFDTVVYNDMMTEFPQIPAVAYIREAYSKRDQSEHPTMPGQIGFVTSVEVAIDLITKNLLPASEYAPIEKIVYKRLFKDDGDENFGAMVFPGWQDCRDFKWIWDISHPTDKLKFIQSYIAGRCHPDRVP